MNEFGISEEERVTGILVSYRRVMSHHQCYMAVKKANTILGYVGWGVFITEK